MSKALHKIVYALRVLEERLSDILSPLKEVYGIVDSIIQFEEVQQVKLGVDIDSFVAEAMREIISSSDEYINCIDTFSSLDSLIDYKDFNKEVYGHILKRYNDLRIEGVKSEDEFRNVLSDLIEDLSSL